MGAVGVHPRVGLIRVRVRPAGELLRQPPINVVVKAVCISFVFYLVLTQINYSRRFRLHDVKKFSSSN